MDFHISGLYKLIELHILRTLSIQVYILVDYLYNLVDSCIQVGHCFHGIDYYVHRVMGYMARFVERQWLEEK